MSASKSRIVEQHDDDVVIVSAVRTALSKANKGPLSSTLPEEYLSHVLRAAYTSANVNPSHIQSLAVGNVLPPGGGATTARMAALHAGLPIECAVNTLNRQCSSGLAAVTQIALEIKGGLTDIGIGAGVESMTHGYNAAALPTSYSEKVMENEAAQACLIPMGQTSEEVASRFGVSREKQDAFAVRSFQKAAKAQKEGKFRDEIVPVKVKFVDKKSGQEKDVVADRDDGVREGVNQASLAKLKSPFAEGGSTHAGNASQITDGAAAVVLARRSVAKRLGLPIRGKWVHAAVVGCPPDIMGVGPAVAIPVLLKHLSLSVSDVDFWEINEAFASQCVYSIEKLGIDEAKVNLRGGAIALGHPLGCTGARQIATALSIGKELGQTHKGAYGRVFVTSMCIGTGMGMAALFVDEQ